MIVCGDVSDTLVSLSLLVASGDHDWRSNELPAIMQIISRGLQFECDMYSSCEIVLAIFKFTSGSI